jgi:hypothetical protein
MEKEIMELADMVADCIIARQEKATKKEVKFSTGERNYKIKPVKFAEKRVYCNN